MAARQVLNSREMMKRVNVPENPLELYKIQETGEALEDFLHFQELILIEGLDAPKG